MQNNSQEKFEVIIKEVLNQYYRDVMSENVRRMMRKRMEQNLPTHKPLRCKALSSNINKRYGAKK